MLRPLASIALCLAAVAAQDPMTAAAVTEPGRTLARPLDVVLGGAGTEAIERTLLLVIDPTAELANAGFADAFAQALQKHARELQRTRIGLGITGLKGCVVLPPTLEHGKVLDELRARLGKPGAEFMNVYADLRAAAAVFANTTGERTLLLVSLENGDAEDEVDQVALLLQKAKVKVHVLTSEATLADSYWAQRQDDNRPRGTTMFGADGAVIDLPWGWLFQITPANETTPAGFATWGLTRIAAATGGRLFLHASSKQTAHQCSTFAQCLFCNGDHLPPDADWSESLVSQLGPLAQSRADTLTALGKDPWFRAMVETWRAAAEQGLVRSAPAVRLSGTAATVDRQRDGRDLDLTETASFERHQKRAEEAAQKCKQLGDQLQATLDKLAASKGNAREEAAARYTRVLLQLTRVNLLTFAAWCRDTAPGLFAKDAPTPLPPEVPIIDGDQRPVGIGYSSFCLCHGVAPFFEVELPGGKALRPELEKLDSLFTEFEARYGKSQFGYALRRNGIAQFWASFPGAVVKGPRKRPKSNSDTPVTTTPTAPSRPPRAGASGGSAGGAGPTTGGR